MASGREDADVLVVGCGPAGAAAAYWLAEHGVRVLVAEKKHFPRDKTCGDGLTPRAVKQLEDMGLGDELSRFHRYDGLRATAHGRELELQWPTHPVYPRHGYVVRRRELDHMVARRAVAAGADLREGHEVTEPLMDGARLAGATIRDVESGETTEVRAKYVVVADGANSRFGRALGTARNRDWPYGTAIRTYWTSPRHDEPWIESALDVKDRHGNSMPGYGWIFPVPGGVYNIGVGIIDSHRARPDGRASMRTLNLREVFDDFARLHAPARALVEGGTWVGRLEGAPLRSSLQGRPGLLVAGEAAGSTYALTGEGIGKALETGLIAADTLAASLRVGLDAALTCERYRAAIEALRPRFEIYERASSVNERPWLVDLLVWSAKRSPRRLARMSGVLEETHAPTNLISARSFARLLFER